MFKNSQSYIHLGSTEISIAGVPSVYKSQAVSEQFAGKRILAAALIAVSVGVLSLQAGFVLNANAQDNPISAPVSTQESPTPTPSASDSPVTSEVTPTPTPSSQPSNSGNNGGNGGGSNGGDGSSNNSGGSSSSSSCNNEATKAPYIVSAVTTGKNEITLTWQKPAGNVTHYSISYGLNKGKPLYGNPNVGNVTSYTVKGLAGGMTYYFRVKAVNDCTPSEPSNEVAVKVGGKFINAPAVGFKPGVLGKTVKFQGTNVAKPALAKPVIFSMNENNSNTGLAGKIFSFFKGLFN